MLLMIMRSVFISSGFIDFRFSNDLSVFPLILRIFSLVSDRFNILSYNYLLHSQ